MLEGWVDLVRRRAPWVLALAVLGGAGAILHALRTLRIDTDRNTMLSAELPFRQDADRLRAAFPGLGDVLVLVVDGPIPEAARAAALSLAERLRAEEDLFAEVRVPRADPFLESAALLFLDEDELDALAARLYEVQPFLGRLSRDPTPRALFELLAQAYDASADSSLPLEPVARALADVLAARRAGRAAVLSWEELLEPERASDDGRRRDDPRRQLVLARVRPDYGRLFPAGPAIRFVRALRAELGYDDGPVRLRFTGPPALAHEELESVQEGSRRIGLLVAFFVALVLTAGLRSLRLVVASLFTLLVGLALTAGFAAVAIGHLNLISVAFAVLFLGLGADFAIHFGLRYREALDEQLPRASGPSASQAPSGASAGAPDRGRAWRESARDVGGSLLVCATTTALGFFAFVPTAYSGVSELGWIAGVGMLIAFAVTVTVLPAALTLMPLGRRPGPDPPTWLGRLTARHRPILAGATLAGAAALVALPGVRFDRNPLGLRDPDAESVATFRDLLERSTTPPWSVSALADSAEASARIADGWKRAPEVGRVVRLESFVPRDQDAKLDRLFDLSLALGDLSVDADAPAAPLDAERAALAELVRALDEHLERAGSDDGDPAARALADELGRLGRAYDADVARDVRERLLGTLPVNLARLERALATEGLELADLPDEVRSRWVAPDGTRRVEAFSAGDLDEPATLRAFVEAVRAVEPRASGSPVLILEGGDAVVRAFQQAFGIALVATTLVLLLLLRSLRDVLVVMVPLGLASVATVATLVLLDEPFNFANVIGLPLLLGIGVDSGVHVLHRARAGGRDPLASSTQRAVVYSALTTLAGFANLSFSPHPGTSSMGRILAIGVGYTLIATLVVLPAYLARERSR